MPRSTLTRREYEALVEQAPILIWRSDATGGCDYFNEQWLAFTGRTLQEERGEGWARGVHPEDRARCLATYRGAFARREPFAMRYRLRRHDGIYRWVFDRGVPLQREGGEFTGYVGSCTDVHDAVEAELRYRTVADFTLDWELWVRPDGALEYVSPSCERVSGYRSEQLREDPRLLAEMVVPEDRPLWEGHGGCRGEEGARSLAFRLRRADGEIRWVEHACQPVHGPEGAFLGRRASVRDVTEWRRTDEALRRSEERFRRLADTVPVGVYLTDERGRCTYANARWLEMTALTLDEALGDGWLRGVHPDDRTLVRQSWKRMVESEGRWGLEYRFETPAGQTTQVYGLASPLLDAGGRVTGYVGSSTDVTEQKQAERALSESRERLRDLAGRLQSIREEERTRIAREIHDELAQNLTALRICLTRLLQRLRAGDAGTQASAAEALGLVDETLGAVRRIAADLRPPVLDELGLAEALRWQGAEFARRFDIPCEIEIADGWPDLDREHSTALFRIFQEALSNVARHAAAAAVRAKLWREGGAVFLEVTDNGRGITPDDAASRRALGILGMRERAGALGGSLDVESAAGGGTAVRARVPLPPSAHRRAERKRA